MQRRRKRYGRRVAPDLWADLGAGDPGYRLRPGRTGFDPFEQTVDEARFYGSLMASLYRPRLQLGSLAILALAVAVGAVFSAAWAVGLVFLAAIGAMCVWTLRQIARHLKTPRRRR